jgi:flagellar basal-body rod protein FlgG
MLKALAIAATGMNAQQTNLEVISNNIANINTTGFKRARLNSPTFCTRMSEQPGSPMRLDRPRFLKAPMWGWGCGLQR